MILESTGKFHCISISHGFLLGPLKSTSLDDVSLQFLRSWLNQINKNDSNTSTSLLTSFRYYSDVRHVASSIISALHLQPNNNNTNNNTKHENYIRNRYICSSADVLSSQFIENTLKKIQLSDTNINYSHKYNLEIDNDHNEDEFQYIQTMDINPVSFIFIFLII